MLPRVTILQMGVEYKWMIEKVGSRERWAIFNLIFNQLFAKYLKKGLILILWITRFKRDSSRDSCELQMGRRV